MMAMSTRSQVSLEIESAHLRSSLMILLILVEEKRMFLLATEVAKLLLAVALVLVQPTIRDSDRARCISTTIHHRNGAEVMITILTS